MIMCLYKKIAITNRRIFFDSHAKTCKYGNFDAYVEYLVRLADVTDMIILREKDLSVEEYRLLADKLLKSCLKSQAEKKKSTIILHTYIEAAIQTGCRRIHLPVNIFRENLNILKDFELIGVSAHSLEDARFAEEHGADYITASHIFVTDCKKGLEPKGLDFLKKICENVKIPVYALGGITSENEMDTIRAGASGACRMSDYMKIRKFLNS